MHKIESLLSARLFLVPQLVGQKLFFISNISGKLSLYSMKYGGSIPQPLLPPEISLQNPHLMDGYSYYVFPGIERILVMIDKDGDENYQPMLISTEGGYPEPAFGNHFENYRVHCVEIDREESILYLAAESRQQQMVEAYQANMKTRELTKLGESPWGSYVSGVNSDHTEAILIDGYTVGDHTLYHWKQNAGERKLLFGKPLELREPGEQVPLNAIHSCQFIPKNGLLFATALFSDTYGLGYFHFSSPHNVNPVTITNQKHTGFGEFKSIKHLKDNRYLLSYNIDGCSWLYEASFNEDNLFMDIETVVCGQGVLSNGVLESSYYDKESDRYALSFSSATSPTQIYTVENIDRSKVVPHTSEKILGIPHTHLSPGEDASYTSFDNTRISARLYLPTASTNHKPPYPVVYYVHGGPQSQERPDFAWFSMPLIQFLTLNGFAVFVPNVRGSSGYGLNYTKQVDQDWGGKDRLDHTHAIETILPKDKRLVTSRTAVVGRSYGGYMSLTLAGRHPKLWSAAVDMFGPYDLVTFIDRIPETWKPYFAIAIGDPKKEEDYKELVERSPRTHINNLSCPLLVIQGKNDPRVVEKESSDLVNQLRAQGKEVEYLVFENEGHDVLKFENRVTCYNAITGFFKKHLM